MIEKLGVLESTAVIDAHICDSHRCLYFEFDHNAHYLAPPEKLRLGVVVLTGERPCCLVSRNLDALQSAISGVQGSNPEEVFSRLADLTRLKPISLDQPLRLSPVYIAKPWGQEIWYSGIEARGVSTVSEVPISWLLEMFPLKLSGHDANQPPLLLKILDPHPIINLGDLYFEMHREKVEVYIVTHIDETCWPTGTGAIRYGFSQEKLAEFDSIRDFMDAYLDQVKNYEVVRRKIDKLFDQQRAAAALPTNVPVSTTQYASWQAEIPMELQEAEEHARKAMYAFTQLVSLNVGDAMTVAPFTPHSLQHGVRVVEFQTPHYERYILSFGQKVLTQQHWDTSTALPLVRFDAAMQSSARLKHTKMISPGVDLVADFDEFHVLRITLTAGASTSVVQSRYALCIGLTGELNIGRNRNIATVTPEQGYYISAGVGAIMVTSRTGGSLLVAYKPE